MSLFLTEESQLSKNNLESRKILRYDDLINSTPGDSSEELVDIRKYDASIIAEYAQPDMYEYTGDIILVRDTLAQKLSRINAALLKDYNYRLKVVYGYRHPQVQKRYFEIRRTELQKRLGADMSNESLDRLTHTFVAVPDVAGHPTGGAVDLTIASYDGVELDMGTRIADFSDSEMIRTDCNRLSVLQKENRELLHKVMTQEEFAPFYGEWWHFSYGDREWSVFYEQIKALYNTIDLNVKSVKEQ